MTLTLSRLLSGILISLSFLVAVVIAAPAVNAQGTAKNDACQIIGEVSGGAADNDCNPPAGRGVTGLMKTAVNILSIVAGIIAVIAIIIAGLKYITSGGDAAQVGSAKNALIYAVIGIVIAGSAQVLVRFVLDRAT